MEGQNQEATIRKQETRQNVLAVMLSLSKHGGLASTHDPSTELRMTGSINIYKISETANLKPTRLRQPRSLREIGRAHIHRL